MEELAGKDVVDTIRNNENGARFGFTTIRNTYIHDGFDIFVDLYGEGKEDSEEGLRQIRIARAFAERLLMGYMGIDFRETSLGQPSLP